MKRHSLFAATAFCTLVTAPTTLLAADLALKNVMLSTGGVGYFEYEAAVKGDDTLTLEIRRDQVDDVLKSIVVYDDRGSVGAVSLPGPEPVEAAFRELPFTVDDLSSPAALLQALRGAEVTVGGPQAVTGRVLAVSEEVRQLPDNGGTVIRHRLTLTTADGLRQLVLEDADTLRFTDAKVQDQINAGLSALAQNGKRERRRLTLRVGSPADAAMERRVRVAYVAAAPLWKASYRLSLTDPGKSQLQGWAVLENVSGQDWQGVNLTLMSGAPVTLRQALYNAYFIDRPEAPVEVLGRVLPPLDNGTVAETMSAKRAAVAPPPPAPDLARPLAMAPAAGSASRAFAPTAQAEPAAPPALPEVQHATAAGDTAQVLFRAPQPVSVADGGTLVVPIVAAAFPVERLALYQPNVQSRHPLAALQLTNGGDVALPPGLLTLYENVGNTAAFVGDARMATLPAGDKRLLSFAVDQGVIVDRSEQPSRTLSTATIADGVLTLSITDRQTTTYTVAGAKDGPRKLIIEHPRRSGWTLREPVADTVETTPTAYRLPLDVPTGETARLLVTVERPRLERVTLNELSAESLTAQASGTELPTAVRDGLKALAALRVALSDKERRIAAVERDIAEQVKEQERLRANLAALPANGDLHRRTLGKMGDIETRLDVLAKALGAARSEAEQARIAFTDRLRTMKL